MFLIIKAFLNKAAPSWTIWAGVILAVISGMPDVVTTVIGWFGDVSPEAGVRFAAIVMFLTRLRSIVVPVLKPLTEDTTDEDSGV